MFVWLIGFTANLLALPLVVILDSGFQSLIMIFSKEHKYENVIELFIYAVTCGTLSALLAGLIAWKSRPADKIRILVYVNILAASCFGAIVYSVRSMVSSV